VSKAAVGIVTLGECGDDKPAAVIEFRQAIGRRVSSPEVLNTDALHAIERTCNVVN